jgi:hypothetical protein
MEHDSPWKDDDIGFAKSAVFAVACAIVETHGLQNKL